MHTITHSLKPLCQACRTAPAELKPHGGGWKKRCSECEHAVKLAADRERGRERLARRKIGGNAMTNNKAPVVFDLETLNALAVRLSDRADQISQITLWDLARDLRLAAQVTAKLASLRFRIAEIAEQLLAHPGWDGAALARDLRDALADAKEGE